MASKIERPAAFALSRREDEGGGFALYQPSDYQACTTPKEAVEFLKRSPVTMGASIAYALNPETKQVSEVFKVRGKFNQRDLAPVMAAGFVEFFYSWAWATKNFFVKVTESEYQVTPLNRSFHC